MGREIQLLRILKRESPKGLLGVEAVVKIVLSKDGAFYDFANPLRNIIEIHADLEKLCDQSYAIRMVKEVNGRQDYFYKLSFCGKVRGAI